MEYPEGVKAGEGASLTPALAAATGTSAARGVGVEVIALIVGRETTVVGGGFVTVVPELLAEVREVVAPVNALVGDTPMLGL